MMTYSDALALAAASQSLEADVADAMIARDCAEIDALNILQATMLAMRRALQGLHIRPAHVVVDGNRCPELACAMRAISSASFCARSLSISPICRSVSFCTSSAARRSSCASSRGSRSMTPWRGFGPRQGVFFFSPRS